MPGSHRFAIALLGAVLATAAVPAPEAAAKTLPPALAWSEKYSEKLKHVKAGDTWEVVPSLKTKASFKVPLAAEALDAVDGDSILYFALGEFEWSDLLSSDASNWRAGKTAAKWVYRDVNPDTLKPMKPWLTVTASWKRGVLRVKLRGGFDSNGLGSCFSEERIGSDEAYVDEEFEAEAAFGDAAYSFVGALDGLASTATVTKDGEEFELAKVALAGSAEVIPIEVDADSPEMTFQSPADDDSITDSAGGVTLEFDVLDASHITAVAYRVDGGDLQTVEFTEVDEGDGTWSVHVEVFLELDTGTHTIEVYATDEFDNSATGVDNQVTFDYTYEGPV